MTMFPAMLYAQLYHRITLVRRTSGRILGTFKQSNAHSAIGKAWIQKYRHTVFHFTFQKLICMLFFPQGVHRVHSVAMTKKAIILGEDRVCILLQNKSQQHTTHPTSANSLSISTIWTSKKQTRYILCLLDRASLWWLKNKRPTRCHLLFIILLLIDSACFGHYYAQHQELATMLLNYHIDRFVLGLLCVGGWVRLGWSNVRAAG